MPAACLFFCLTLNYLFQPEIFFWRNFVNLVSGGVVWFVFSVLLNIICFCLVAVLISFYLVTISFH